MHAVDSPHDATALAAAGRVFVLEPGKKQTKVLVAAEFDTARAAESRRPPAAARDERRRADARRAARVPLRPARRARHRRGAGRDALALGRRDFGLPPGIGSARVILRDPETGALGSVSTRFEVPEPRAAAPLDADPLEPGRAGEQKGARPQPAISVDREFPAGGGLYCQFEVVGARKGPDGKPKVTAGVSIWTSDGGRVRELPASPVAVDADGRAVRLGRDRPGRVARRLLRHGAGRPGRARRQPRAPARAVHARGHAPSRAAASADR
jgi:hypothetical protein